MQWQKETIILDDHTTAEAQVPFIISASRATDIPTFYSDWFISRWKASYIKWINPCYYFYIRLQDYNAEFSESRKPLIKTPINDIFCVNTGNCYCFKRLISRNRPIALDIYSLVHHVLKYLIEPV